jgi:hypothetical protein
VQLGRPRVALRSLRARLGCHAQGKAINLYRRLRGAAPLHPVLDDGVIAGAVYWIARRKPG